MTSRKRRYAELESPEPSRESGLLNRIRSMWEFSNLMQYIFIFGKAVKIDEDLDIEDLETECLSPAPSEKLADIGLALLKIVSSHRGLTPEIFDEYARRQYVAKAPTRNVFGTEEVPKKFADFDIFTKIRVLQQLSQWTLINADRMREKMPETKDTEQVQWRVEDIGVDRQGRLYFVLDDNRLYRRTDPQLPTPPASKPKSNSKKGKALARAKRRKIAEGDASMNDVEEDLKDQDHKIQAEEDGFGGRKWECVAISLSQYQGFLESIKKSKNVDERDLHARITEDVLEIIEKAEEAQQRKIAKKERELINLQKLATAKRSSRIACKQDKEREEQEAIETERKRHADLLDAKKDREKQKKMDEARESRMITREQRLKEREYKRILHEEELANLSEDSKKLETGEARMSERHLKAEMEKRIKELDKLAKEDEWVFDCSKCGVHGENLDDGSHSVACEKCNVWQHSACLGISQAAAEKDNFQFICDDCKRREEDAKKPKIPSLKFKVGISSSPPSNNPFRATDTNGSMKRKSRDGVSQLQPTEIFTHVALQINPLNTPNSLSNGFANAHSNSMHEAIMNGPTLSPQVTPPPLGLANLPKASSNVNSDTQQNPRINGHKSQSQPSSSRAAGSGSGSVGTLIESNTAATPSVNQAQVQPSQYSQYAPRYSYPPGQPQNPSLNTVDDQRSSSSHSPHKLPSPIKSRPSLSPTQGNLIYFPDQNHNGTFTNAAAPGTAIFLPTKHLSSPPSLPPASNLPSSSPVVPTPIQHGSQQMISGLSPTKHSPPRTTKDVGLAATPVLPPVANLSPSPKSHERFRPPVKAWTPEWTGKASGANGI